MHQGPLEAHEAVVDVQQVQAVRAEGVVQEPRADRGVHAPGGQEEDLLPLSARGPSLWTRGNPIGRPQDLYHAEANTLSLKNNTHQ